MVHLIEPLPPSVGYQDMVDFAAEVGDERAGRRLAEAGGGWRRLAEAGGGWRRLAEAGAGSAGKGAFRRFKAELHEEFSHLLPAWYAFRDARAHRRAVEWLADNSLIADVVAACFLAEHPEPSVP